MPVYLQLMRTYAYDVLDALIEAKYTRQKLLLLDRANLTLEKLRFQFRLAHDGSPPHPPASGGAVPAAAAGIADPLRGGGDRA